MKNSNLLENILITEPSKDYELLDSGDEQKLERFGNIILSRPDPQALWLKSLSESEWQKADAIFTHGSGPAGKWLNRQRRSPDQSDNFGLGSLKNDMSKTVFDTKISRTVLDIRDWRVSLEGLTFGLKLLPSKHVGVFPEQSTHWKWLTNKILHSLPMSDIGRDTNDTKKSNIKVLNLFGYTGGATLACAKAGASVVHVDSSEWAVNTAKENAKLSGLVDPVVDFGIAKNTLRVKPNAKIHYRVDDVRKFVEREVKRGNKYDVIILDPPVYGKGKQKQKQKQIWKIEEDLMPLLLRLKSIISSNPLAIILNGYSSIYSHITYAQMLRTVVADLKGEISSGELAIKESSSEKLLPSGIFARWEK